MRSIKDLFDYMIIFNIGFIIILIFYNIKYNLDISVKILRSVGIFCLIYSSLQMLIVFMNFVL